MKLVINQTTELDIDQDTVLTYNSSSAIFSPLAGEWTYPGTLPATRKNLLSLGNPHLPSSDSDRTREFPADIWLGSFLFASGVLRIRKASAVKIQYDITVTPAGMKKAFWQKNLNELDLGSEAIPIITKTSEFLWSLKLADIPTGHVPAEASYDDYYLKVTLKAGDRVIADQLLFPDSGKALEINSTYITGTIIQAILDNPETSDIVTFKNNVLSVFTYEGKVNQVQLLLQSVNGFTVNYDHNLPFAPVVYNTINPNYFTPEKLDNEIYALPEVKDTAFYADPKSGFCGVINKIDADGKIQTNQDGTLSRNTIIPFLKVKWVFEKIAKMMDYTIIGDFWADPDMKNLVFFNLYSTDKIENSSFNTHDNIIKYANHLPELKVLDFFKAFAEQFGIAIEPNVLTKTLNFYYLDPVLSSSGVLDITGKFGINPEVNPRDRKKVQVKWQLDAGDSLSLEDTDIFQSNPTKQIVEKTEETYDKIELLFSSLVVSTVAGVRQIPQLEQSGITPVFGQTTEKNPTRFLFVKNNKADNRTDNIVLSLQGNNSLFQKRLKGKIDWKNKAVPFDAQILLSLQELMSLRFSNMIRAFNLNFLVEEFSVKLRKGQNRYVVDVKILRQ